MKAIRYVFCLCAALVFSVFEGVAADEDFKTFLQKFTSSASFQYSRVKFPLKSPISLLKDDGETEQTFPFTREKWHNKCLHDFGGIWLLSKNIRFV